MLNGYELKFPSKGIANALYSQLNYKDLKGQKSLKIDENFIIKGDNLDALKILAKGYTNSKVVFISNARENSSLGNSRIPSVTFLKNLEFLGNLISANT